MVPAYNKPRLQIGHDEPTWKLYKYNSYLCIGEII